MRLLHKAYILLIIVTFLFVYILPVSAASFSQTSLTKKYTVRKSLKPKVITFTPSVKRPTVTPKPTIDAPTKSEPTPSTQNNPTIQSSDIESFLIDKVNDYRRSQGLSEVKSDPNTCAFAKTRAEEIVDNFNHDGFTNRIDSHTLPYSDYSEVTENIAMTSDYTEVVDLWINSPGHAANMRKNTPFVCIEKSGNYYAYEGWRP
jgi:uncharacterized protein YkwD